MNRQGDIWTERATPASCASMDIGFLIHNDLYYGHPNDPLALRTGRWRSPLYKPQLNVQHDYVYTGDPTWQTEELIKYYEDLTKKLLRYRVSLLSASHYFWTKLYLKLDDEYVMFPWTSTIDGITRVLNALNDAQEGEVFFDGDDGWEIVMLAKNGTLYIRESDPDEDKELAVYSCPLTLVQRQAHELLNRINPLMDELRTALAVDYWSRKLYLDLSIASTKPRKRSAFERFLFWYYRKYVLPEGKKPRTP